MSYEEALKAQRPLERGETHSPDVPGGDCPSATHSGLPYYASRDDLGEYTIRGRKIRSVTTTLGKAPGSHLMNWYGKQAALKAASHLFQSGLIELDDEVLRDFCAGLVSRDLSPEDAFAEIADWRKVMREARRYRDHKARIGSVVHHAIYRRAIGADAFSGEPSREQLIDYLSSIAIELRLLEKRDDPEFIPTKAMVRELAESAYAYVLSAFEWIDKAKPEWEAIGLEAVVCKWGCCEADGSEFDVALAKWFGLSRTQFEKLPDLLREWVCWFLETSWAGRVDAHIRLHERSFGYEWRPEWGSSSVSLWADFKTSNSLSHKSVQAQVEAYAHSDFIVLLATDEEHPVPAADLIGSLHIGPHASASMVADEFGTLESHAKVTGAKLFTYDRSRSTILGFAGLTAWADYCANVPRAHQQRKRTVSPKSSPSRFAERECPI